MEQNVHPLYTCMYMYSAQNDQNAMLGHFSVFDSTKQELHTWQDCNSAYATLSIDTSTLLNPIHRPLWPTISCFQGHFGNLVGN